MFRLLDKKEKRKLANQDLYMGISKLYPGNLNNYFALEEIILELLIL
jgi:hypothetical protein